ncbi:hypothetical protein EAH79_11810 [Sphingomonas koreensis]|nr:hypothetical protein EAH79_11810 [Sphingomonas koreensis]
MKRTTEIITKQRRDGAHPCDGDGECMVSTASRWCEDVWLLDSPSRNLTRTAIEINWVSLPERLVPLFKDLFWSVFVSRPDGQPYALSQAGSLFSRLRYLAKWMEQRKRHSLASISPAFVNAFVSDLKTHLAERSKEREADYTTGSVVGYLKALDFAFEQRGALAARGHPGLGAPPFGEASGWGIAEEIAPYVESFTPAIPDELVIPIVMAAYRYIRDVADDVIELQTLILASESRRISKKNPRTISYKQFRKLRPVIIREYAQQRLQDKPWLADLVVGGDNDEGDGSPTEAFRRLMADVVSAAVIVVRFSTGIRHGEILTFAPGLNDDGLPLCVERETSIGGAYELFFVKGVVSKGWDHPEDTRWLLAGRVNGTDHIPDAVRALQVIELILAPWRDRSSDPDVRNQLLLQFGIHGFPTNRAHILPMLSEHLAKVMKEFYERRVDLSGVDFADPRLSRYAITGIRGIQSKQWRKTWANFVIRTNRKLLPAIAQQFQHFSTVLTQEAYIGKDAQQLGLVEDAATERAIEFVHNALEGNPGVGGMARKAVDKLDDLKVKVRGIGEREQREEIRDWLAERDIKVWPAQHGKCFIGLLPGESRCHAAGKTLDWSNQAPNFLTRNARLCSGCACFGVDGEDIPFWADRYLRNKRIWDQAVEQHLELHYTVARDHYRAAETILRSLDVDIDQLKEDYADAH